MDRLLLFPQSAISLDKDITSVFLISRVKNRVYLFDFSRRYSEQTLTLLEKAIILELEYVEKASKDKDFDSLWNDERFKALTT